MNTLPVPDGSVSFSTYTSLLMNSPFPYKLEITDPVKRIKFSDMSPDFQLYMNNTCSGIMDNPPIKHYKKDLIQMWMNYKFGPDAWDFEDEYETGASDYPDVLISYKICVKDESLLSMVALQWQ